MPEKSIGKALENPARIGLDARGEWDDGADRLQTGSLPILIGKLTGKTNGKFTYGAD